MRAWECKCDVIMIMIIKIDIDNDNGNDKNNNTCLLPNRWLQDNYKSNKEYIKFKSKWYYSVNLLTTLSNWLLSEALVKLFYINK